MPPMCIADRKTEKGRDNTVGDMSTLNILLFKINSHIFKAEKHKIKPEKKNMNGEILKLWINKVVRLIILMSRTENS